MKILADATLLNLSRLLGEPFSLTLYNNQDEIPDLLPMHDILLCRSTLKVTAALLRDSPIQCVATASSGIDHIDCNYLKQHNIALFDAKGCNASAVADYIVSSLAFLYSKSKVMGFKAGVIGVGEVGTRVVARLRALDFDVICYDPFKENLNNGFIYCSLDELSQCDVLCVHANLHNSNPYPSFNLLGADFLANLKSDTIIINAARGGILNEEELLRLKTPITYCTDVYNDEPKIHAEVIEFSTLCTPHIAGHSIEAKQAALVSVCKQLYQYYGLTIPKSTAVELKNRPILPTTDSWTEHVLSLYNPEIDTQLLKAASNKKSAFLVQRRAHHRHDFTFYDAGSMNKQIKALLGQ